MRVVILSIGSELLRGDIVDTNAAFLARQVSQLGFQVQRVEQIGDDLPALTAAVADAFHQAELTLCTGGLGPTQDDLTRDAIAAVLEEPLHVDEGLLDTLKTRFGAMGRDMPLRNIKQAQLIPSAQSIPNPNGTAPGWLVRREDRSIIAMPGPPGEMQPMWEAVQPRVEEMLSGKTAMLSLMTFGVGESAVEELIDEVIGWHPDVTVATYAKTNGVQVHVTARGQTQAAAEALAGEARARIEDRLGEAVFGTGDDTLSAAIGRLLERERLTVAVMESCTGGELANLITNNSGSSDYFRGGIVAYSAEIKAEFGVDPATMKQLGLISSETALSMAQAARRTLHADIGLGVTGIAGTEPIEGKSPGTVFVAMSLEGQTAVREIHRPSPREIVKHFAAQCTLDLLRRELQQRTSK